jgi:hypothetical protein
VLIAEELLLLIVGRGCGELPRREGTQTALAAAVLVEVAASGRLAVDPLDVTIADDTPLDDPILDAVREPGTVSELLRIPGLYRRLLDRLTEQGVLTTTTRWWTLGLASKTVWRPADPTLRDELKEPLKAVLGGLSEPDVRTGTLIALLHAMDVLHTVLDRPGDEAMERAEEIADGDWPADEVTKAIIEANKVDGGQWTPLDDIITGAAD